MRAVSHLAITFDASAAQLEPKAVQAVVGDHVVTGGRHHLVEREPAETQGAATMLDIGRHDQRSVRGCTSHEFVIQPAVVVTSGTPLASASSTT